MLHASQGAVLRPPHRQGLASPGRERLGGLLRHPDAASLSDIEKGILAANIGITPLNDGRVIRVPIPELDEERRKEIVKVARRHAEDARVAVRNVRRDANDAVKALQKDGKISEDQRDTSLTRIQKDTDATIAKIDADLKAKEA